MKDLTPTQLQAGIDALHTCRAQSRPDSFTVALVYRAILEVVDVVAPAAVEVQVIGTGGGPDDDHANPVTDQEAR